MTRVHCEDIGIKSGENLEFLPPRYSRGT